MEFSPETPHQLQAAYTDQVGELAPTLLSIDASCLLLSTSPFAMIFKTSPSVPLLALLELPELPELLVLLELPELPELPEILDPPEPPPWVFWG